MLVGMDEWSPRSWQCPFDPEVRIDLLRTGKYAIRCEPCLVLGRDRRWDVEPDPSNRDKDFIANYRFDSLDEAKVICASAKGVK